MRPSNREAIRTDKPIARMREESLQFSNTEMFKDHLETAIASRPTECCHTIVTRRESETGRHFTGAHRQQLLSSRVTYDTSVEIPPRAVDVCFRVLSRNRLVAPTKEQPREHQRNRSSHHRPLSNTKAVSSTQLPTGSSPELQRTPSKPSSGSPRPPDSAAMHATGILTSTYGARTSPSNGETY
jgi:hypothetical protein